MIGFEEFRSNPSISSFFNKYHVNDEDKEQLYNIFYEYFLQSSTCEHFINKLKENLSKISQCIDSKQYNLISLLDDMGKNVDIVFTTIVKRIDALELESKLNKSLILAADISVLYYEYYVKNVLIKYYGLSTWDQFTSKLKDIEDEINDNQNKIARGEMKTMSHDQLYKNLNEFLISIQAEVPISLTDIRNLRAALAQNRLFIQRTESVQIFFLKNLLNECTVSKVSLDSNHFLHFGANNSTL
ncbi:unnamed protein product [Didymodactylos carnosus]|uniref:Uncharacterized protein n=1 Tax=Didymodactylos carnosus TaxID=1234261 RepID=A0A8S2RMW3_9BILA|nr:unnamed protein product [Didymodactylos carnosus]CAF4170316.1 unnamed protein product [Didymodactylos carnosus]